MAYDGFVCSGCGWDSLSWNRLVCPQCETPHPNPMNLGLKVGQPIQVVMVAMGDRYEGVVRDPCEGDNGNIVVEFEGYDGKQEVHFRADGGSFSGVYKLIHRSG